MKKLLNIITGGILALGITFGISSTVLAQSYLYVTANGEPRVTAAATPAAAIDTALNRAPDSGVMEITVAEALPVIPVDANTSAYAYVTVDGNVAITTAETPAEAINLAENRLPTSGVMTVIE